MLLSARARVLTPSPTFALQQKVQALKAAGKPVISLVAGEPDFDTPTPVKQAAIKALKDGHTKYTDVAGILPLRQAIAKHLKDTRDVAYEPDQVIVTAGAKQALYNALQVLVGSGDEVIVPSPYWVSYPPMVKLTGADMVVVPTREEDGFLLKPGALEAAITPKTRVLIVNSPNNPTGATYNQEAITAIGRVVHRHRLVVLSDEIYSRLTYGVPHFSMAAVSQPLADHTVLIDGMSKAYAMTGWRMGYAAGPREIIKAMSALQSHSTSNATSIAQHASLAALSKSQRTVETMRREFERRRNFVVTELGRVPGWSCRMPTGAFYAYINVRKTGQASAALAEQLLMEGHVALIPGVEFGTEGYLRLSYAASMKTLQEAMKRIHRVFG